MENNIKGSWYHSNWQTARLKFILSKYPSEFFKGKRILELGACNGYFSAYFQSLGAEVLAVEGRLDNIEKIKEYYPTVNVEHADLDTIDWQWGKWDIIINFGLWKKKDSFFNITANSTTTSNTSATTSNTSATTNNIATTTTKLDINI